MNSAQQPFFMKQSENWDTKNEETSMKCEKCNKNLFFFRRKYYDYMGEKKGSFEITNEKIYCRSCFYSFNSDEEREAEVIATHLIKMHEKKYQDALKDLEKHFDKRRKDDW